MTRRWWRALARRGRFILVGLAVVALTWVAVTACWEWAFAGHWQEQQARRAGDGLQLITEELRQALAAEDDVWARDLVERGVPGFRVSVERDGRRLFDSRPGSAAEGWDPVPGRIPLPMGRFGEAHLWQKRRPGLLPLVAGDIGRAARALGGRGVLDVDHARAAALGAAAIVAVVLAGAGFGLGRWSRAHRRHKLKPTLQALGAARRAARDARHTLIEARREVDVLRGRIAAREARIDELESGSVTDVLAADLELAQAGQRTLEARVADLDRAAGAGVETARAELAHAAARVASLETQLAEVRASAQAAKDARGRELERARSDVAVLRAELANQGAASAQQVAEQEARLEAATDQVRALEAQVTRQAVLVSKAEDLGKERAKWQGLAERLRALWAPELSWMTRQNREVHDANPKTRQAPFTFTLAVIAIETVLPPGRDAAGKNVSIWKRARAAGLGAAVSDRLVRLWEARNRWVHEGERPSPAEVETALDLANELRARAPLHGATA